MMMQSIRMAISGAVLLIAMAQVAVGGQASSNSRAPKVVDDGTVIEDVTVISPERAEPLAHASVVIRGGRIAEIGKDLIAGGHARRIDGRGKYLIPGLMDTHVHVAAGLLDYDAIQAHPELLQAYRVQLPKSYLAFGFTTLVDLDHFEPIDWFTAEPVHPNLYHCGRGVHIIGGYGAFRVPRDAAEANAANVVYESARAKDWPQALNQQDYTVKRAVDRVVEAGGVCVKTFVESGFAGVFSWPVPQPETLAALREETRRRGLVFLVHATAVDSWRAAIDAHADVIAHGLWHWPGDRTNVVPPKEARDVIQAAKDAGIRVQPTMQTVYGEGAIFDTSILNDPRMAEALPAAVMAYLKGNEAETSRRALEDQYHKAGVKLMGSSVDMKRLMAIAPARVTATVQIMQADGVKLLLGSDTPAGAGIGNPPGLNGRLELERWFEAGVPLDRILRAATLDNAVAFGLEKDSGTIQEGKRADLLLLNANPLKEIGAYDAIGMIFVNGNPIAREALLPASR